MESPVVHHTQGVVTVMWLKSSVGPEVVVPWKGLLFDTRSVGLRVVSSGSSGFPP